MSEAKWFTPVRLLLIFCTMNFIIYLDRGALSSTSVNGSPRSLEFPFGTGIQGQFNLTLVEDGLLASAFMVGLVIASPIFAELSKQRNAFRLVGIGLLVWLLAVLGCGLSFNYTILLICRMLVGVGEASFVTLAAPFIDDNAPPHLISLWFGLFQMCTPSGYAAGYIYGGVVGMRFGWRAVFFIEAAVMLPLVVFCFIVKPIDLRKDEATEKHLSLKGAVVTFVRDVGSVLSHPMYIFTMVANTFQTGIIGVFAFWGPRAGQSAFDLKGNQSNIIFGIVTVLTGIGGTLAGGVVLDKIGASFRNASLVSAVGYLIGLIFMFVPFAFVQSIWLFIPILAIGEAAIFLSIAPNTGLQLWAIPSMLRPLGCSLMTVVNHILGDVPSPPIAGKVKTFFAKYVSDAMAWRMAMGLSAAIFFAPACTMFIAACFSKNARDYREEVLNGDDDLERTDEPLLKDSKLIDSDK